MEISKRHLREMKFCRFCFSSDESKLSSIYSKEAKSVPLPIQIMSCLSIEVISGDGLPEHICEDCKKQLRQSYTFKTNCKKSDDAFKSYLITGKLIMPILKKYSTEKEAVKEYRPRKKSPPPPPPLKDMKALLKRDAVSAEPISEPSEIKRMKLDDGTEVITLCISDDFQTQEENVSEDSTAQKEQTGSTNFDMAQEEDVFEHTPPSRSQDEVEQIETDIFACNLCDKTFPLEQLLDLHMPSHEKERNFPCDLCDLMFFSKSDMVKHQQTHSGVKPFKCSICSKEFAREGLLRRHEQTHPDAANFVCQQCGKTFLDEVDLENHMKKHEKSRPFQCLQCDKSFVFKQGLERHVTASHNDPHQYQCNYCDAGFGTLIRLTRHLTHHAGLRPYPCKLCGRTFLLSHHLTRHMKGHYGGTAETIGQHRCDICSMSFKRMDSLLNHTVIHSMVNLKCVICNTSFESAQMVKDHITTHLQNLPFQCGKCDYSFEIKKQLIDHELKHAQMEYEELIEKEVISEENGQLSQEREIMSPETAKRVMKYEMTNRRAKNRKLSETSSDNSVSENEYEILEENEEEEEERGGEVSTFHIDHDEGELKIEVTNKDTNEDSANLFLNESEEEEGETVFDISIEEEDSVKGDENIKPVVRSQGTKMYKRKGPVQKRILPVQAKMPSVRTADPEEIDEKPELGPITPEALSNLPAKKPVNVKVGDQVVKVQKFIISKEEMKQMAKMGILEVKNGQVIMKTPGQPIINAKIKPVQRADIENLINGDKNRSKTTTVKQYKRKGGRSSSFTSQNADNAD